MNDATPSTTQPETTSPETETEFVCDYNKSFFPACQGEPFFREHEGKRYCVLHYPDADKMEAFRVAFKQKLEAKDFNFEGVWFPEEVSFRLIKFDNLADFTGAIFSADANFDRATFNESANFSFTRFDGNASFYGTTFSSNVSFSHAIFGANANFEVQLFDSDTSFYQTTFKNYVKFSGQGDESFFGEYCRLNFQFTYIEKPDHVSFHTNDLKPHWFINCDCRKFEFVDCEWNHDLKQELEGATKANVSAPHRLLAITFRQLADNAEANHRYHEASDFRYNAFEARRIENYQGFAFWRLDWWYWLASGYGERVGRAFVVFIALFALFAFGYGQVGFEQGNKVAQTSTSQPDTVGKPLGWKEAFVYSFNVSILQKPEPKPLTLAAKVLVSLETVLGPAQAALLALAVRRRFMR